MARQKKYATDEERKAANRARNREAIQARRAARTPEQKEKELAWRRARRAAMTTEQKARDQAWRFANPERWAYLQHKSSAKARDVSFRLSFSQWCAIWRDSGKWEQRGARKDCYVMARFGDIGPYAVGNVRICTVQENHAEQWEHRRGMSISGEEHRNRSIAAKARWVKRRAHRSGFQN